MARFSRNGLIFTVLGLGISLDQLTKAWIIEVLPVPASWSALGNSLWLGQVQNRGAFLSMGAALPEPWRQGLWTCGNALLLAALLLYLFRSRAMPASETFYYSLIAAGGLGNWLDRLHYHGYVLDFINVGIGSLRTGIFNLADMALTAGAMALLVQAAGGKRQPWSTDPGPG